MNRWLKFWKIKHNFKAFLQLNNNKSKEKLRKRFHRQDCVLFFLLLARLIHLVLLSFNFFHPELVMTDYARLLQTDVTLFTGSPTSMNVITNSLYYQSLYFIYFLHLHSGGGSTLGTRNPAVALVYNVLIRGSVKFFAVKWVALKGNRKWQPVSQTIADYLSAYVRYVLYPFASVSSELCF